MPTKQEIEQQLADAIVVAQRLNTTNKELTLENKSLTLENENLKKDFFNAVEKVRYLDGQVKMLEAQRQSANKYSDTSKNY